MRQFQNIQFTVNGIEKIDLQRTLEVAFKENKITHWLIDKKQGLYLFYDVDSNLETGLNKFLTPSLVCDIIDEVWAWLKNQDPNDFNANGWDGVAIEDHYTNNNGWKVYAQSWGLSESSLLVAQIPCYIVKPVYVWHG